MNVSWKALFVGVALVTTLVRGAYAEPDFGSNCASCHSRTAGQFNVLPSNLVEIFAGATGQVTFNVTQLGSAGQSAALAVFGLNAPALMATPNLTGWNEQDGGTYLSSDFFTTTGQVPLQLTIGAGATLGDYPINVTMAGGPGSDWSRTGSFTIRVATASLAGDYNGDGKVDAADYVAWRKNPTAFGGNPTGYNTWRDNFGESLGAGSAARGAVPEPAPGLLLLIALVGGLLRRRIY
jgi:hypothetical protein